MKRLAASFAALVCTVGLLASVFVGTSAASNTGASDTLAYHFSGCTGPAPLQFDAVKTELPDASPGAVSAAAAFRLTGSRAIYVVLSFGQGNFNPPGISNSSAVTVTCTVNFTSGSVTVSGRLAPSQ